jgi:polysaccharide chain length determinant protein (PEP-CTERM system associated)
VNAALEFILEQIRGIWRFRWTAMLVAWVICLVGWVVVLVLPDTYSSWARVFVDTRTRMSQVTAGIAVESNVSAQVEAVREALLGGPELEKVARGAIPGFDSMTPARQAGIIDGLRARLTVEASGERNQPADLYVISYTDHSRNTREVVDQLLKLFMANALHGSQVSAQQAQNFLTQQIAEYEKKLAAGEAQIADFKRKHAGLVPGNTGGDYFARLNAVSDQLNKDKLALSVAEQKREELQRQISGEQPLMGGAVVAGSAGGATDTGSAIREAQARLDELLQRYTDKHPDVIAARGTLEDLKHRQALEKAAIRRGDPAAISSSGLAANPVYQGIRLQLSQADVEVGTARRQLADEQAQIDELHKMINVAPEVEAEFARLSRDYDVTRTQYQALVERLGRAKLSDQADATGVVRFEIVDPPTGGLYPVAPDRVRLILTVLLGGLAAGLGVAYLLHQLRPVFTSTRQLTELTQLPVLGAVSMTWLERHKAAGRRAVWTYSVATAALVLLAFFTVAIQGPTSRFLHGLVA